MMLIMLICAQMCVCAWIGRYMNADVMGVKKGGGSSDGSVSRGVRTVLILFQVSGVVHPRVVVRR